MGYELSSWSTMAGNNGAVCIAWSSSHEDHRLHSYCPRSLGGNRSSRECVRYEGLLPGSGPQIWRHFQLNSKPSTGSRRRSPFATGRNFESRPLGGQCVGIAPALEGCTENSEEARELGPSNRVADPVPKPSRVLTASVRDRSHSLGRRLLGAKLRPLLAQASLSGMHGCVMARAIAPRLAVGQRCCAPCRASLGCRWWWRLGHHPQLTARISDVKQYR
jgi:hypothetical protein